MDLSSFETRAAQAEKQLEQLTSKVNSLEKEEVISALRATISKLEKEKEQAEAKARVFEDQVSKLRSGGSAPSSSSTKALDRFTLPSAEFPHTSSHEFSSRTAVKDILGGEDGGVSFIGKNIILAGWARTIREQGGKQEPFAFIELNDGSCLESIQIVCGGDKPGFADITGPNAGTGAAVRVIGTVIASTGKNQKVEVQAIEVQLIGPCVPGKYPLAKGKKGPIPLETLREIAHLRPRTNIISAMARVRNSCALATHLFFQQNGFFYVHTPIITASDCEGAGEMFQVTTILKNVEKPNQVPVDKSGKVDFTQDFFGKPAFLTVSGQLNGEMYATALSKIYTFGPTFRAENSNTSRHMAEFWMIEPEIAFADLSDNMDHAEAYLKFVVKFVLQNNKDDLDFFEQRVEKGLVARLQNVIDTPFKRLTYTEAVDILLKSGKEFKEKVSWGIDLSSEHERFITEEVFKQPVILTDYPKDIKAFYMRLNEDNKTVRAMDVLVPRIGEIIGGSQREERLDHLEKRIDELKLDKQSYSSYLDLRRFGSVMHSGFGLGFERLVMFVTGIENIRDSIPFPRTPGHAEF